LAPEVGILPNSQKGLKRPATSSSKFYYVLETATECKRDFRPAPRRRWCLGEQPPGTEPTRPCGGGAMKVELDTEFPKFISYLKNEFPNVSDVRSIGHRLISVI
jgi:hypothetical protein